MLCILCCRLINGSLCWCFHMRVFFLWVFSGKSQSGVPPVTDSAKRSQYVCVFSVRCTLRSAYEILSGSGDQKDWTDVAQPLYYDIHSKQESHALTQNIQNVQSSHNKSDIHIYLPPPEEIRSQALAWMCCPRTSNPNFDGGLIWLRKLVEIKALPWPRWQYLRFSKTEIWWYERAVAALEIAQLGVESCAEVCNGNSVSSLRILVFILAQ